MRPAISLARLALLLALIGGSQQLSISELVVPRELQAGQDAELQCRIDYGGVPEDAIMVKWWWMSALGSADRKQLYQRIAPNEPQPQVNHIRVAEKDSIVLVNATPAYSGVYECEVSSLTPDVEQRLHAPLTVYTAGCGPQLNVSEEAGETDVIFTCRAEDVAPEPDIVITFNGEEVNMTEEVTGPDAAGLYQAVGRVSRRRDAMEDSHVECELLYLDTNVTLHKRYRAELYYYHSGAPPSEEPRAAAAEPGATDAAAVQNPSGGSCECRVSWALLLVIGLLAQVPALL